MQTKKREYKKISLAVLTAALSSLDGANLIINKTVVSPGSVVHGNTGIIINGKQIGKGRKNSKVKLVEKKLPKNISVVKIFADDVSVSIVEGNGTVQYDQRLSIKEEKGSIVVASMGRNLPTGPKIILRDGNIVSILVKGDASVEIQKPLESLTIDGDSLIKIETRQKYIKMVLNGDANIEAVEPIAFLSIDFQGDLVISGRHIDKLALKGKGDVVLDVQQKNVKIIRDFDGDLIKGR